MSVLERMEPGIDGDGVFSAEAEALASIAISLKRIADALWGDEKTTGIVLLLNHIESNGRAR